MRSIVVKKFHSHMPGLAMSALNHLPASRRDISSVAFPIKESGFPKLKKHLQWMRKELRKFASDSAGDGIVQVNFRLFPLTKGISDSRR